MIQIRVALPNAHEELLSLPPFSTVQDLKTKAQRAFGRKCLRLIDPIEEAEIKDGECLNALVLQPQLAATQSAFALWCHGDNAVVTWGNARCGGDSSSVQDQLRGVQQIQATGLAFAAILQDGSVVTWGDAHYGVRHRLKGVQQIQATSGAFAAILEDGSVVSWGRADEGGDSSPVQDELKGVQQIQATFRAFAAILADGSVVTWGSADYGGISSAVNPHLKHHLEQLIDPKASVAGGMGPRVLVPLCGKTVDMVYLSRQGYRVVGVEGVRKAVEEFAEEFGLRVPTAKGPTMHVNFPPEVDAQRFRGHAVLISAAEQSRREPPPPVILLEGDFLELGEVEAKALVLMGSKSSGFRRVPTVRKVAAVSKVLEFRGLMGSDGFEGRQDRRMPRPEDAHKPKRRRLMSKTKTKMIQIRVALPNAHEELLTLPSFSTVQDLKTKAQRAFGRKCLRLIDPIEEAEIKDGECLNALVLQPQLAATQSAFALWCHGDNAVVTWGNALCGGDSSSVQDQLRGVQQIQATGKAFAAILADGSAVTWGDAVEGGDSSAVRDQLKDGSVVTWGRAVEGGDSSEVRDQLRGAQQIQASAGAFAAILEDGSVVTWGDARCGGDSSEVQDELKGVQQIHATWSAFAAILADGSVVTWGRADSGGDSSAAAFDRGSLVAVEPDDRPRYAKALTHLMASGGRILLVAVEHDGFGQKKGPPFQVAEADVRHLFGSNFHIQRLGTVDALDESLRERGASRFEESVYLLTKH
eukprot:symbB.v1.2.014477.t1/scaffold1055.1/size140776/19